jgi:hypothetical protein
MPRKPPVKRGLIITNPSYSSTRLPSGHEVHALPGADPVTPLPRRRVGEMIQPSDRVTVTNLGAQHG